MELNTIRNRNWNATVKIVRNVATLECNRNAAISNLNINSTFPQSLQPPSPSPPFLHLLNAHASHSLPAPAIRFL